MSAFYIFKNLRHGKCKKIPIKNVTMEISEMKNIGWY
jgi:hypothetical protein